MDSFELNKIAGAVLFALLVSFGLSIASEMIFETEAPEAPGYMIAVAEPADGHGEGGEAAAERPHIATLLASADPGAGAAAGKKCGTCHTFGEGEANKVGPNLYGVVMRPIASHPGYEYSPAMVAYAAEAKAWDYDQLDAFLHSPPTTVPKTKMAFAGLKNDAERANVIAYLRTLAASPAPLPEAPAVEASAPAATATDAGTGEAAAPAQATAEQAPAEGAAPAVEQPAEAAEVAGVAAQDPATNQATPEQQAAAPAEQPALAEQPATAEQDGAAGGEQAAAVPTEGASEGGTRPQLNQPQGTLGPIDSTTADQQGAVPQVAPIEQPAPEPTAGEAEAKRPAEPAPPAAPQQAAPAEQPAAPADATAPPAAEQQVAQSEAPAQPAAPAAEGATEQPAAASPAAPAPGVTAGGFAALVAAADATKGMNVAKRCLACHSFEKGAASKIGPVLWDVVNRPIASVPDFKYSEAMKAFSEGGQKLWTVDELSAYLENPKGHIPGNKMAFPGLKKEDERANLIGYLHTLSENPAPLQ